MYKQPIQIIIELLVLIELTATIRARTHSWPPWAVIRDLCRSSSAPRRSPHTNPTLETKLRISSTSPRSRPTRSAPDFNALFTSEQLASALIRLCYASYSTHYTAHSTRSLPLKSWAEITFRIEKPHEEMQRRLTPQSSVRPELFFILLVIRKVEGAIFFLGHVSENERIN